MTPRIRPLKFTLAVAMAKVAFSAALLTMSPPYPAAKTSLTARAADCA